MIKVSNNYKGLFYPDDPVELGDMIEGYLKLSRKAAGLDGHLRALIVPHAGYMYSGPVAAYSYAQLQGREVEKVVLIGPSHNMLLDGLAATNAPYWDHPFEGNPIRLIGVNEGKIVRINDLAFKQEHSLETQIPFLVSVLPDVYITPLVCGEILDYTQAAEEVGTFLDDKSILVVSSDLSHYHSYEQALKIDKQTIKTIQGLDPVLVPEQACGYAGINLLINLARKGKWKSKLLDYRNSADTAGNRSQVVGYLALAFYS